MRPDHRWLLMFDSADSPEAVLQVNGLGEMLITVKPAAFTKPVSYGADKIQTL